MLIGVLAMQGAFREHRMMLERCGASTREVRSCRDLEGLNGLIVPGGESTTISNLLLREGLFDCLEEKMRQGLPVFGTCAGMVLLAREVIGGTPPTLGVMDLVVRRNAYGRQVESFEADLDIPKLGTKPLRAIFIRAPYLESAGEGVEILGSYDGRPVLARQGRLLVSSFHPELTDDSRVHRYFLGIAEGVN